MTLSAMFGIEGTRLKDAEKAFFAEVQPAGFILFARNIDTPEQVRALTDDMRALLGNDYLPILIDQEGGRVRRLRPPHWRAYPPMALFGRLYEKNPEAALEALRLNTLLLGADLNDLGITVDCLPVLDVPVAGAHDIIGDRAFSHDPAVVAEMGRVVIEALHFQHVHPVIKHIPGHGRGGVDSHENLPVVDTPLDELIATDFVPFKANAYAPFAMTAHIVYSAIDAENPATFSKRVTEDIIRGEIGFNRFLLSDDLSMKALKGDMGSRTKRALDAGCDIVLHCNGQMDDMQAVAGEARELSAAHVVSLDETMQQTAGLAGHERASWSARLSDILKEFGERPEAWT